MLKTVRIIHGTAALVFLMGYAMHLSAQARVTRIVIDEVKALSSDQSGGIQTEQVAGRDTLVFRIGRGGLSRCGLDDRAVVECRRRRRF